MSPATIVLREEPYLLVHFLEYHNIYLSATGEGSTILTSLGDVNETS